MKLIAIIVFLVIVGGLGALFIKSQTSVQETPLVNVFPSTSPSENWLSYSSQKYNYSFSYPPSWQLLAYKEDDPGVLMGTHTLHNYDANKVEAYMDHGIIDWEKFMGDKMAIKVDLTAQNLEEDKREEFLEQYFKEATKQPETSLEFGSLETTEYSSSDAITDQLIRGYIAFPSSSIVIMAHVYVPNKPKQLFLEDANEWQELKNIFSTFKFGN